MTIMVEHGAPTLSDWDSLLPLCSDDTPILDGRWFSAWADCLLPQGRFVGPLRWISLRRRGGAFLGGLPLVAVSPSRGAIAALAGYYWPFRMLPIAAADPDERQQAVAALAADLSRPLRGPCGLRMGPVRQNDTVVQQLTDELRRRGWSIGMRSVGTSFHINLPPSTAEFEKERASIVRHAARYGRRIRKDGEAVIVTKQASSPSDWSLAQKLIEKVEMESWLPKEGGDLLFSGPRNAEFWLNVNRSDWLRNRIRSHILYFNGEPISFFFNIDIGSKRYVLAHHYSEQMKAYSPGSILARHMVADAIANQIKVIDWGLGDSGHKRNWGAEPAEQIVDLFATAPGLFGGSAKWLLQRQGFQFSGFATP